MSEQGIPAIKIGPRPCISARNEEIEIDVMTDEGGHYSRGDRAAARLRRSNAGDFDSRREMADVKSF